MKNYLYFFPLLMVLVSACSQKQPLAKDLSAKEFKSLLEKKQGVVLDVRTPEEVVSGKISQSINLNYFGDFKAQALKLDKTKPIYVYCASGGRSTKAMQDLNRMGFIEVYNLLGGFGAWRAAKFPEE